MGSEQMVQNGIIYFKPPYLVDFIDFGYEHLDCDSIIVESSSDNDEIEVVCCAQSEKDNNTLISLYNQKYKGNGYCLMHRISSLEATSID